MEDKQTILRRNIKLSRLVQSAILTCFGILLGILLMQPNNRETVTLATPKNTAEKQIQKVTPKKSATVKVLAGVNYQVVQLTKKPVTVVSGVSKHMTQLLKEPYVQTEKVDHEKTTATKNDEPKTQKIRIEDVKISRDMDLTKTTGLSREDFCELLANFEEDDAGFYERNAGFIWDLSQKYKVNEIFMCGVFGGESNYGRNKSHIKTHNYASLMLVYYEETEKNGKTIKVKKKKLRSYLTDEQGIEASYKLLANEYLNPEGKYYTGGSLDAIGLVYDCEVWADLVYGCMKKFLK